MTRIQAIAAATYPIYNEAIPEKGIKRDCLSQKERKRQMRWVLEVQLMKAVKEKGEGILNEIEAQLNADKEPVHP
jgi:hypothetical protein